jgi:Ni,Fe-hydrogenase III component G
MDMTEHALQLAETLLGEWTTAVNRPESSRMDVSLDRENFTAAAQALVHNHWGYLAAITGLDHPPFTAEDGAYVDGHIEALYHFCHRAAVLTLRVSLPYSYPVIDTICELIPSATLYERELMELFGVEFTGTPDPDRLVLPDDWPDDVYPLRKSFTGFHPEESE